MVSYPDLILMDLPEDSPLRKPILTIKESGAKAATIVQDLLTLSRRGVVVTEVTNLNHVIQKYLESPEFEKLKEFHPNVKIENNFYNNNYIIVIQLWPHPLVGAHRKLCLKKMCSRKDEVCQLGGGGHKEVNHYKKIQST